MKHTSIIHSVGALVAASLKLSFSKQYKI